MAKMSTQQRLNILAASTIGLCELLEEFFKASGILIPEVKVRLDSTQELCYQVCPEAHSQDFSMCYAAVHGQGVNLPDSQESIANETELQTT